jgi:hypothetical protein
VTGGGILYIGVFPEDGVVPVAIEGCCQKERKNNVQIFSFSFSFSVYVRFETSTSVA